MKRFILLVSIFFFISCAGLLGIKKIKSLDDTQIASTAVKFGIEEKHLFKIDTGKMKRFYLPLKTSDPDTYKDVFQPLQVLSFLPDGSSGLHLVNCHVGGIPLQWNRFNTFDSFPLQQKLFRRPAVDSRLEDQLEYLLPVKEPLPSIMELREKEEIVFVYWTAFMGKHTAQLVSLVKYYLNRFPEKKIQVYWVNIDNLYS